MEYTPEQLNYFRLCYITFSLVPDGLRKIFKQEWDFLYKTTPVGEWKDTPQNGLNIFNKESRRSRTRNAQFLATIQNGNTAEWGCRYLFFAILYSDSIGSTLSPKVRKNVDDLRQIRNYVTHITEARLNDTEFQYCVGKVIAAFNSLNLPIADIEEVKNQVSFPTVEVNKLKKQADKLQVGLTQAKSDLQVAQDTIQKKEERVESSLKECNKKALMIRKGIYGDEDQKVTESYYSLAYDYRELGQHNEAKECDEKALMISKKIFGEEHPQVAASYQNLAFDYRELGQHNEAKECDEQALMIRKRIYGEQHPDEAASYHNLSVDYRYLGLHNEAKKCAEKALMIRKRIYDEQHPDEAASCHNLSVDYRYLGLHNEAKKCAEKALMISQNASGDNTTKERKQSEKQLQVREENKEGTSENQSTNRSVSVPLD